MRKIFIIFLISFNLYAFEMSLLNGPSAIGALKMINDYKKINISIINSPNNILASIIKGEADIAAVPANMASIIYNRGLDYKAVAVVSETKMFIVSSDKNIKSIDDLKNKTIYCGLRLSTPDLMLQYLIKTQNIKGANINYSLGNLDLSKALASKKVDIAKIGQYSENKYFGKPCGLMDQMGCSIGGIMAIDFKDNDNPKLDKVEYDFEKVGYALMIVDAKGNHSSLTNEYAAIREEMNLVARYFSKEVCRDITKKQLLENASNIRKEIGDRAFLGAYHFITENERVVEQINALKENNIKKYINLMNESGLSSFMYLQNCYSITSSKNMGVALAIAMTKDFLQNDGAVRVHGGGFAGTIQALIPLDKVKEYTDFMDNIFGKGSAMKIRVRQSPVCGI